MNLLFIHKVNKEYKNQTFHYTKRIDLSNIKIYLDLAK